MNFLILFLKNHHSLDREETLSALENISEINAKKYDSVGSIFQGSFDFGNDSTIVRLKDDLKSISISGTGDASLKLALEIQKRIKPELIVTDSDYSFETSLKEISTIKGLRQKMTGSG